MALYNLKDWKVIIAKAVLLTSGPASVTAVPVTGMNMLSHTKITFDPGGDAEYVLGAGMKPLGVAIKSAKGKLDIDFGNAAETWKARSLVGGIGSTCIISLIGARSGMPPVSFIFTPSTWKNGGGMDVDESKGTPDKVSFLFTDCLENGKSIYNVLA